MKRAHVNHLALNPQNVVVLPGGRVKLVNFGQAQELPPHQDSAVLTESYSNKITAFTAPEIGEKKVHKSSDIYSFGLLLTILFDREFQQRSKAKNSLTSSVREGQASDKWIDSLSELIKKMSVKAPAIRIKISEVEAFFNEREKSDDFDRVSTANKSSKSERITRNDSAKPVL